MDQKLTKIQLERLKILFNIGILVFLDFLLKKYFLLTDTFVDYGAIRFYVIKNKGIAFGWLSFVSPDVILWVNAAIILIFVGMFFFKKHRNYVSLTGYGLILAGAVGNFIDRLNYGYVVDYIHLYNFPVFNLSDVMISLGVIGVVIGELIGETE